MAVHSASNLDRTSTYLHIENLAKIVRFSLKTKFEEEKKYLHNAVSQTPDHPSLDHSDSPAQLYASLKECTYATEAREKKTSVVYFSNKAHTQKKKKN